MQPSQVDIEFDQQLGEMFDKRIVELCEALGFEQINPVAAHKLKGILKYYSKKVHPWKACYDDNLKRFGPDGAARVCATLKDQIMGTTHWRGKHNPAGMGPHPYTGLSEGAKLAGLEDVEFDIDGRVIMSQECFDFLMKCEESDIYHLMNLADYNQMDRMKMAKSGEAMPDLSFPIKNVSDLHNAIQAIGRSKNPAAAKKHIIKRAKALGAENDLPDSWAS